MGCGIIFPRNYECKSDSEEEIEQQGGRPSLLGADGRNLIGMAIQANNDHHYVAIDSVESGDEDEEWAEWGNDQVFAESGVKVQVRYKELITYFLSVFSYPDKKSFHFSLIS